MGRAGRAIPDAYGILLAGKEDADIHKFFREAAFPPEETVKGILQALEKNNGLSIVKLQEVLNVKKGLIEQTLKYLSVEDPSPITKIGSQWKRTAVPYKMDTEKIQRLTNQRLEEWDDVKDYIATTGCLMNFLQEQLDDPIVGPCGRCANCIGENFVASTVKHENILEASIYLKHSEFDIEPRKQIPIGALPIYKWPYKLPQNLHAETGKALSRWGDAGWGQIVADGKHHGHFNDDLVDAVFEMITQRWKPHPFPEWLTSIPSLNHPNLVPDFARRLAEKLGIPFHPILIKAINTQAQKEQENSFHQCRNLDGAFQIDGKVENKPLFLVDDAVDSRWTFTIAAALLKENGSGSVYPVALATTSVSD